jgi:hypothetical protein
VIDEIARSVTLGGRVKGAAWRAFTPALAVRFTLLMTLMPLMPDAGYPEVAEALIGDLALVAWRRPYRVPTAAADCTWREGLGPVPLERLRDRVLAGVDGEHRSRDYRAVMAGELEAARSTGRWSGCRTPRRTGKRSGRPAPPMTPRPTRSYGSCGSAMPPPAPPWA